MKGRKGRGLRELCQLLGYTPQAFYQYGQLAQARVLREELLLQQVLHHRTRQPRLGSRKLHLMLAAFMQDHGLHLGRDGFFDLLRSQGLLIRKKRPGPRTTFSRHRYKKYPDLFKGALVSRADQVWVSDITYVRLRGGGFAYLSLVTDVYSRKIIGYALLADLSAKGPQAALRMAISQRRSHQGLLHHSDRGCQYCSDGYTTLLRENRIAISMTQSGDPRDNAIAERVNGILKGELLEGTFANLTQARLAVKEAIMIYNQHRPHSSVGMLTPAVAYTTQGELARRWKSYYKKAAKEVSMDG